MKITDTCCICENGDNLQLTYDKFKGKHNNGQGPMPSASDPWSFLIAPGRRTDSLVADTSYINIGEQYPGTVDMEGTITVGSGVVALNTVGQSELSGYSLSGNTLTVTSVGGAGDRFATMQDAYDWLKSSDRDSEMGVLSSTNRRLLKLNGASFNVGSGVVFDSKYIDVLGLGKDTTVVYGDSTNTMDGSGLSSTYVSGAVVELAATHCEISDFTCRNSNITNTRRSAFCLNIADDAYSDGVITFNGNIFSSASVELTAGDAIKIDGTWYKIKQKLSTGACYLDATANGGVNATEVEFQAAIRQTKITRLGFKVNEPQFVAFNGTADVCVYQGMNGATWTDCTGDFRCFRGYANSIDCSRMVNCRSIGGYSFFGDFDNIEVNGEYINCVSEEQSFCGCSEFANAIGSQAFFQNCIAGNLSFGLGKNCAGSFYNCIGGDSCFGGYNGSSSTHYGEFSGYAKGCIAGNNSFGSGNANCTNSGTMEECKVSGLGDPMYCEGAEIRNTKITVSTTDKDAIVLKDSNSRITHSEIKVVQGGTGIPINADSALNVVVAQCTMNNASNDADGLGTNVTNLVATPYNVVDDNI